VSGLEVVLRVAFRIIKERKQEREEKKVLQIRRREEEKEESKRKRVRDTENEMVEGKLPARYNVFLLFFSVR